MKRLSYFTLLAQLVAGCTALSQKDAYLDALPRAAAPSPPVNNTIFTDDFESGLGKWTQTSGTWTTTSGASGLGLLSPSSATPTNFSISTASNLDLTGKSNCILDYDIRFLVKGVSGVSATVLFSSTIIGNFKDTSGLTDMTSSTIFVHRQAPLPNNGVGRISFATTVVDNSTGYADLRIDNVSVTCNNAASTSVTLAYDNLNSSASNWALNGGWAWQGSGGSAGSAAMNLPGSVGNGSGATENGVATFGQSLDFSTRFGCRLDFYYGYIANFSSNCLYAEINGSQIWAICGALTTSGSVSTYLTAFEGIGTNSFAFRCRDLGTIGGQVTDCTIDEVRVTCQQ